MEQSYKTNQDIKNLCKTVKQLVSKMEFSESVKLITKAMSEYPDSPQPHNLIGIVYEKSGNHCMAMKHFRASYALDPTYSPAEKNLYNYGTNAHRVCIYDEDDEEDRR